MIDALDRLAVDIILLVGTLESFKVHYFDPVVLKIKLLLLFQYCQCFHNLEFYKVNTMIVCHFSGMYLPSVERLQRYGERAVRYAVIEQPAYNADASVWIALREAERVRCMVIIERDFAWMVWILLPFFQSVQTILE